MKKIDITRAWKDTLYRQGLTPDQLKDLPSNPAGSIELPDDLIDQVAGGDEESPTHVNFTSGCCKSNVYTCLVEDE